MFNVFVTRICRYKRPTLVSDYLLWQKGEAERKVKEKKRKRVGRRGRRDDEDQELLSDSGDGEDGADSPDDGGQVMMKVVVV